MKNTKNHTKFRSSGLKSLALLVQGSLKRLAGTISRNTYQSGARILSRITRPLIGITRYNIRAYIGFWRFLHKLYKHGGMPFVVKYLKASSVLLQQAVAGTPSPGQPLGAAVAKTRSGIPRIIPRELRARIRSRDRQVIRTWLTIFNLYRVLEIPGKLKLSTITDPGKDWDAEKIRGFGEIFFQYILRTNSAYGAFYMNMKGTKSMMEAKPFLIAKSSGTSNYSTSLRKKIKEVGTKMWSWADEQVSGSFSSTSPLSVSIAAVLLRKDTALFPLIKEWCELTENSNLWNFFEKVSSSWDPTSTKLIWQGWMKVKFTTASLWLNSVGSLGKLGFKPEPAGKIRVFAMVDCWTQWLLKPLHDSLFSILKAIPQDGTFDQHAPIRLLLDRVVRNKLNDLYSFDLSAATDRLPVGVQQILLESLIGHRLAFLWRGLLTWRGYQAKSKTYNIDTTVHYAVGQPMGALSSWAMLAFTHHFLVQWSAYMARKDKTLPFQWFEMYAVLGDDVVIGDKHVASKYVELMEWLGVEISLPKSLISHKRVLEFAKTFWIPENATPLPFMEFLVMEKNSSVLNEYSDKYDLSLPDIFHALGYGYKTKGSLYTKKLSKMGHRVRRILVMLTAPTGPFAKSLRDWLTMESLVKSVDSNQWDRVASSVIATEFPTLIRKLEALKLSLAMIVAGDPVQGEPASPHIISYDEEMVTAEIMRTLRKNPRLNRLAKRKEISLVQSVVNGVAKIAFKVGDFGHPYVLSSVVCAVKKSLASEPELVFPQDRVRKHALFLLDRSYRISQRDMDAYGFVGDRESYLILLYKYLYSGSSKKNYLEVSKLLEEVQRLQLLLKSPQNWHELSTNLSQEKLDVYAVVELLWDRIKTIEDSIDDVPSLKNFVRQQRVKGYNDPSVKLAKFWARIRRTS